MNVLALAKRAAAPALRIWDKHDSTILTTVTIVATGAAVVFALKDGPKCEKILREKKEEGASNLETAKAVLPVAGRTMMAVAVAWGSAILNHKRTGEKIVKLAEALAVASTLREDTKKATEEVAGKETADEIDRKVMQNRASDKPVVMSEIENTGHGTYIFREPMTGKTFRATKDFVELIVNNWSCTLREAKAKNWEDYEVRMTDIFDDIGLSRCGFADLFVWKATEHDDISVNLNNTFEYEAPDGTKEPGYIMDFYTKPVLAYSSYCSPRARYY